LCIAFFAGQTLSAGGHAYLSGSQTLGVD